MTTPDAASQESQASQVQAPRWMARIHVTLKPVVLDPQGDAVLTGLHQLGYADVSGVRVGKYLEVSLSAPDHAAATEAVTRMCERLLANPVIERYQFTVEPGTDPVPPSAPPTA